MPPLVSLIIPVRNGEKTIRQAVESVLNQTLADFELLVVDDGSTDRTGEILASFSDPRMKVIRLDPNRGRSFARNHAAALARGEFLAMLDADDWSDPRRLEAQAAFLRAHPDVALCGAWAWTVASDGALSQWRQPVDVASVKKTLPFSNPIIHSTAMIRRQEFLDCGGYDEALHWSEDYDLFLRLGKNRAMANIPEFLGYYRETPGWSYRAKDHWHKSAIVTRAVFRYGYPLTSLLGVLAFSGLLLVPASWKRFLRQRLRRP